MNTKEMAKPRPVNSTQQPMCGQQGPSLLAEAVQAAQLLLWKDLTSLCLSGDKCAS